MKGAQMKGCFVAAWEIVAQEVSTERAAYWVLPSRRDGLDRLRQSLMSSMTRMSKSGVDPAT
jgi:hypothetical protein